MASAMRKTHYNTGVFLIALAIISLAIKPQPLKTAGYAGYDKVNLKYWDFQVFFQERFGSLRPTVVLHFPQTLLVRSTIVYII